MIITLDGWTLQGEYYHKPDNNIITVNQSEWQRNEDDPGRFQVKNSVDYLTISQLAVASHGSTAMLSRIFIIPERQTRILL